MNKNSKTADGKSSKKQTVKKQSNSGMAREKSTEAMNVAECLRAAAKRPSTRTIRSINDFYVGIDLGDKKSNHCFLAHDGSIVVEGIIPTTQAGFRDMFASLSKCRIAIEVGTHSPWVYELLESMDHEVFVANTRKMESIHKNRRKNDKVDARTLARFVRADPELLYPIMHRGIDARRSLVMLRARQALVDARTKLINCVRGLTKSTGSRIPKCSGESFHNHAAKHLPDEIRAALEPLVEQIAELTGKIREYDKKVECMATKKYPETINLRQVGGVGPVTSLAYVLTLENPERFEKSRDVGPYVGLIPRQDDSGECSKQLRITKTGDKMLRKLLVGSAQYILGPFGEDCDLRRFGLKLAARGGKNAKKRAVVAVARKLAVLLHRLWTTGEVYEPLHNSRLQNAAKEAATA